MIKPKNNKLTASLAIAAFVAMSFGSANAAITITNTGSRVNQFSSGSTLATLDFSVLSTTTNTAVFFIYEFDGGNSVATATFAGEAMTIVRTDRVVIGYLANSTNKTGNIVLSAGTGTGNELAYWGLAQGIDTTDITTAVGSSISGNTQTNATLPSLNVGDVVFSGFAVNNFTAAAYSGGLVSFNGGGTEFDGIVTTDTVGTAGNFAASTTVASGAGTQAGISIAFTAAIPEPSAAILGSLGVLFLFRRRRA